MMFTDRGVYKKSSTGADENPPPAFSGKLPGG